MRYCGLDGAKLRKLRREKGLTLKQLATRTSLSVSFLSQVERGISQPSISSLTTVCNVLGAEIPSLLGGPENHEKPPVVADGMRVSRSGEAMEISIGRSEVIYEYLSGAFPGRVLEILLNRFPANHQSEHMPHPREEFGYVLSGSVIIRVGETSFGLTDGDSYHLPANTPHSYTSDAGAEVLIVSTGRFLEWERGA